MIENVSLTTVTGGPGCGKTTFKLILRKAAKYLSGFYFFDMSEDVIAWHLDTRNNSPFREKFSGTASTERKKGNLLGDSVINDALEYYLNSAKKEHGIPRHAVVFGWPRSDGQIERMQQLDSRALMVMIHISQARADENRLARIAKGNGRGDDDPETFANRWDKFNTITHPACIQFGLKHPGDFLGLEFAHSLKKNVLRLIAHMRIGDVERRSLTARIFDRTSEASLLIKETTSHSIQAKASAGPSKPTTAQRVLVPA